MMFRNPWMLLCKFVISIHPYVEFSLLSLEGIRVQLYEIIQKHICHIGVKHKPMDWDNSAVF